MSCVEIILNIYNCCRRENMEKKSISTSLSSLSSLFCSPLRCILNSPDNDKLCIHAQPTGSPLFSRLESLFFFSALMSAPGALHSGSGQHGPRARSVWRFPPTRLSQQTPTLVIKHTVGCHDELRPQEEITFSRMLVFKSARQSGKRETRQLSIYHREEEDVQAAE